MEEDQEESNNPDEKIGIGIRIRNKFKTIGEETKAIKGGIIYLLFYRPPSLSTRKCNGTLLN